MKKWVKYLVSTAIFAALYLAAAWLFPEKIGGNLPLAAALYAVLFVMLDRCRPVR